MIDHSATTKMINVGIRTTTLICRFFFIFFLAKLLDPSEVGLYGLVTATVAYSLYLVGLDFYTYSTRELAVRDRQEWGGLLKNQLALSLVLYAIVLPMLSAIFIFNLLPAKLSPWFFMLVVVEHICQELTRLFVATSEQLAASIVLFLRQGTWAIAIVALMLYSDIYRNLESVLTAWLFACAVALGFSVWKLRSMGLGGWRLKIDRGWIFAGIRIALPLLVATLAVRGVFTLDRYGLQFLAGLELVGAYVLFFGVSNTLMAFLDAGVFSFAYPSMIRAIKDNDALAYQRKMKEMVLLTVTFCGAFALVSLVALPFLLEWLDKDVYLRTQYLYYWLLLATMLSALSMIPHYGLYSQNKDTPIVHSHVGSLPMFIVATAVISIWDPVLAVPIGLCLSQLFVLIWKLYAYTTQTPKRFLLRAGS